jgi:uncharacterized RDD family membrane protein YckC
MQKRGRRTMIDISRIQPGLDFDDDAYAPEFTLPHYQRRLLLPRAYALLTDLGIVFGLFLVFVLASLSEMTRPFAFERRLVGIYGAAYVIFVIVYLALFMLGTSQTAGMRIHGLKAVNRFGRPLGPPEAFLRSFGYLISIVPLLFGLLWAFVDPEHLTWADKVSRTYVKRA